MSLRSRLVERYHAYRLFTFAWWVPPAVALLAIVVVIIGLAQRRALTPPGVEIAFGLIIVTPWLIEHISGWFMPRWLFAVLVIGGTGGLLVSPVETDFVPFVLFLLAGEAAATTGLRAGAATAAAASALMIGLELTDQFDGSGIWVAGIVMGWALGLAMQRQMQMLDHERSSRVAADAQAALVERQRIAREIHDVVAHSLSVTMLHLTAARHELETDDDVDLTDAVDSLRRAEQIGRDAMADIRRTVGMLDNEGAARRPLPGMEDIDDLVAEFVDAGLDIRLDTAVNSTVPPAVGLAAYRIVQEALANVARHAPGRKATCALRTTTTALHIDIVSDRPDRGLAPSPNGRGLRSMRERAELLGGRLEACAVGERWSVTAELPLAGVDDG